MAVDRVARDGRDGYSGALCYGELAARFPEAGGGYVYLREAYGPGLAFLYGWKCFLVMDPGITAALATGAASYIGYIINLSPLGAKAVAIAAIILLATANILGVRVGTWLMQVAHDTQTRLACAHSFVGILPWAWRLVEFRSIRRAARRFCAACWRARGRDGCGVLFIRRVVGREQTRRRSARPCSHAAARFTFGVCIVTLVYIMTSAAFIYLVPVERATSGETFAAQAGEILFGRVGGQIFSSIVIISVLGSLLAGIITAPRVYYAMARDGVFLNAAANFIRDSIRPPSLAAGSRARLLLVTFGTFIRSSRTLSLSRSSLSG